MKTIERLLAGPRGGDAGLFLFRMTPRVWATLKKMGAAGALPHERGRLYVALLVEEGPPRGRSRIAETRYTGGAGRTVAGALKALGRKRQRGGRT